MCSIWRNPANNAGMFRDSVFANVERFVVGGDFATSFGSLDFRGNDAANYLAVRQGALTIDMRGGNDTVEAAGEQYHRSGDCQRRIRRTDTLIFTGKVGINIPRPGPPPANNTGPFANATFANFEIFQMGPVATRPASASTSAANGAANNGHRRRRSPTLSRAGRQRHLSAGRTTADGGAGRR